MIWFCSWLTTLVIMTLIWLVYHLALNGDVALLSREMAEATPAGWPDLSRFAVPLLQAAIYLLAVLFWWRKRREVERLEVGARRDAGLLVKLGALLRNPARGRLTSPFVPFMIIGVVLALPLVTAGVIRPSLWGFCMLWCVTLAVQTLFPWFLRDKPDTLFDVAED
jgi:hypothetical protein